LKKNLADKSEQLMVGDLKLQQMVNEKFGVPALFSDSTIEVMRGIRSHLTDLIAGLSSDEVNKMQLGLSHSLSCYKLKFSPDKVDVMIVQAIALLDELDKQINTCGMRLKEWYGLHFPELAAIVPDNFDYARTAAAIGLRGNHEQADLAAVGLSDSVAAAVHEAANVSFGSDLADSDLITLYGLTKHVIAHASYRTQLQTYLASRMHAIAPSLAHLVGDTVGARLIAHAGSLTNLAKCPASTIQILGAEKALFRALKTKHATPKYGLIFSAALVGSASTKSKGKAARMLAAKGALAARVDAFSVSGKGSEAEAAIAAAREFADQLLVSATTRIAALDGKEAPVTRAVRVAPAAYVKGGQGRAYNDADDVAMDAEEDEAVAVAAAALSGAGEKRPRPEIEAEVEEDDAFAEPPAKKSHKDKKDKKEKKEKKDKKDKSEKKDKSHKKEKKEKKDKKDKKSKVESD
jgi:nucleolar protein 58